MNCRLEREEKSDLIVPRFSPEISCGTSARSEGSMRWVGTLCANPKIAPDFGRSRG